MSGASAATFLGGRGSRGSLLAKLGARDRVQLVVFAYEHGLV